MKSQKPQIKTMVSIGIAKEWEKIARDTCNKKWKEDIKRILDDCRIDMDSLTWRELYWLIHPEIVYDDVNKFIKDMKNNKIKKGTIIKIDERKMIKRELDKVIEKDIIKEMSNE